MAETIRKALSKTRFFKQIAEFDNNLFIFGNWKWLIGNFFLEKLICNLLTSHNFLKFAKKQ